MINEAKWLVSLTERRPYTRVVAAVSEGHAIVQAMKGRSAPGYPQWWSPDEPQFDIAAVKVGEGGDERS